MAPVETLDAEELVALLEAEEALLADGHGHALVGCAETVEGLVAVYDHDALVARLAEDNGWSRDEALEWFYYNIVCAYVGPRMPVYLRRLSPGAELPEGWHP